MRTRVHEKLECSVRIHGIGRQISSVVKPGTFLGATVAFLKTNRPANHVSKPKKLSATSHSPQGEETEANATRSRSTSVTRQDGRYLNQGRSLLRRVLSWVRFPLLGRKSMGFMMARPRVPRQYNDTKDKPHPHLTRETNARRCHHQPPSARTPISVNLSGVVCVDAWVRRGAWRFPSSISVFA